MGFRVVLVNPPPLSRAEKHDLPSYPHAGLGYLAAALLAESVDVVIVDAKLERLSKSDTIKKVVMLAPSLVGFTSMTHDVVSAANIAAGLKSDPPAPAMVLGGVHATALPTETLASFAAFDFSVFGEGEETFVELVAGLRKEHDFGGIRGLAWRDGDSIRQNEARLWNTSLDALPQPAWELFPPAREYHVVTARGCPYSCVFCMAPYGHQIRERSPANVVNEMSGVVRRFRPRHYKVNDESFGFNHDRGMEILDRIVADPDLRAVPKTASLRVNSATEPFMRRMKAAGFVYVDFGIESGDPVILERIQKRITPDMARRGVAITKRAGISVGGNFIFGHPGETTGTALTTIRFAVELNCDFNAFGIMTPYPGTKVYEMAKRGEWGYRLTSDNWRDFNKQIGSALEIEGFSRRKLEIFQLVGYISVYLLNFRVCSFAKFVWEFRRAAFAFLKNFLKHPSKESTVLRK